MKKKIVMVLMVLLVATMVTLVAQGAGEEKTRIAFIPQLIGIPYFTAMEQGGNQAAADLGVQFMYVGATEASASEQSKLMDSLIKQQVDAIAVSVLDSSSMNPMLETAKKAGVKVYTSDSDSPSSVRDIYVAQAMDKDLGYTLIDELAKNIGDRGKIGIVSGEATATNLNAWIGYMQDCIDERHPNIEVVDIRYTVGGSSEDSLKQAQELMIKNPDLKAIVAVASSNIAGVSQAVEQAGKIGQVDVIGYGSPATVKPYMDKGIMTTSILWDAKALGYLTVWAGVQMVNGTPFSAENTVPTFAEPVRFDAQNKILLLGDPLVITKANVDQFDF
jgi:rhamnose transport system substrate-binding protein